jgi:hypothetical protein
LRGRVLFPEKPAKAHEIISKSGLPEIPTNNTSKK